MKNDIKNIKGITLIALIVTIIVILIIAGISINMIFGDNSILKILKPWRINNNKTCCNNNIYDDKKDC